MATATMTRPEMGGQGIRIPDEDLDEMLREQARRMIASGQYPTSYSIISSVGLAPSSRRAQRRLDAILNGMDMPEEHRRRREVLKGAQARRPVKRAVTPNLGIDDEGLLERRQAVLRDFRLYFARPLTNEELRDVLDRFEAADARVAQLRKERIGMGQKKLRNKLRSLLKTRPSLTVAEAATLLGILQTSPIVRAFEGLVADGLARVTMEMFPHSDGTNRFVSVYRAERKAVQT